MGRMVIHNLLKNKLFLLGLTFLICLLIGSFTVEKDKKDEKPTYFLYDENGIPIDTAPFPPSLKYPFGSDKEGNSVLIQVIEGAKYTIGFAIVIAILRLLVSLIVGAVLYLLPKRVMEILKGLTDSFYYAPLSIFTYVLVAPVIVTYEWSYDERTKLYFPIFILVILAIPILSIFIANEIEQIFQKEFIRNAKLLGGGKLHIFKKHAMPYITPRLFIVFSQQVGQVLMIFAHLGLLKVFIGGTLNKVMEIEVAGKLNQGEPTLEAFSMTNEWGGLIAKNIFSIQSHPWLILAPVTGFALAILAINFIVEGIKASSNIDFSLRKKRKRKGSTTPIKNYNFEKINSNDLAN